MILYGTLIHSDEDQSGNRFRSRQSLEETRGHLRDCQGQSKVSWGLWGTFGPSEPE